MKDKNCFCKKHIIEQLFNYIGDRQNSKPKI